MSEQEKIKGVNLGNWLIAEYWMCNGSPIQSSVPGDIGNCGEYAMMEYLGKDKGNTVFKEHRDNAIVENDIQQISQHGFNAVRVPVGWFIKGYQKYITNPSDLWNHYASGGLDYLDKLINEWCPKYNITCLISLHAACGSQNGQDHSACCVSGKAFWSDYPENILETIDSVKFLVNRYKTAKNFLGIGLLNEPGQMIDNDKLRKFYTDCYATIRNDCQSNCLISYMPRILEQDLPSSAWKDFLNPPEFTNCMFELHFYEVWNCGLNSPLDLWNSVEYRKTSIESWQHNWLNVGEWSAASRNECNIHSKQDITNFLNQQLDSMKTCKATFFWNWRMYSDSANISELNGWSALSLITNGLKFN